MGTHSIPLALLLLPGLAWAQSPATGATQGGQPGSSQGGGSAPPVEPLQLKLKQCARLALDNDLGLTFARLDARRARAMYAAEDGRFLPYVRAEVGFRRQILGTELEVEDRRGRYGETEPSLMAGVSGQIISGMTYDLVIGSDMLWTSKKAAIISPQFRNRIELELSHPLLKDFGIGPTTTARKTADIGRQVAVRDLETARLDALAAVVVTYWTLYGLNALKAVYQQAVRQVAAHRASFDNLPKRMQPDPAFNNIPELALASWQVELSGVESARLDAERALLVLIYGDNKPSADLLRRGVRPADRPAIRPVTLSLAALTKRAQHGRPELAALDGRIRAQKLRLALADNHQLPRLDAFMTVGLHSFAGTQTLNDSDHDQVTVAAPAEIRGKYGDSWEQLFEGKLPYFWLGLRYQMPISTALRQNEFHLEGQQLRRLNAARERLKAAIAVDVRRAYRRSINDATRFRQSQAAYEGIAQRLQRVEAAFKQKIVRPPTVVTALDFLRNTGKELAKAAAAYMISRARLERATGKLDEFLDVRPSRGGGGAP